MTGFYDKKPGQQPGPEHPHDHPLPEHDHPHPHGHEHGHDHAHGNFGHGHNIEHNVVWERWQKKRTFVRALEGTYSDLAKELLDQPRVYSEERAVERRAAALGQAHHQPAGLAGHAVDRDAH